MVPTPMQSGAGQASTAAGFAWIQAGLSPRDHRICRPPGAIRTLEARASVGVLAAAFGLLLSPGCERLAVDRRTTGMDDHRAPPPTTGRLPLRQGEARPRAPRSEMIESRPERAPRRPEPRRPHPLRRRSAQAFSNRPATAGGRARMTGRAPTCAVVAARRYSDCTTVRGPPRPPLPTATRRGRRRTPTPLGLKMAVPLA